MNPEFSILTKILLRIGVVEGTLLQNIEVISAHGARCVVFTTRALRGRMAARCRSYDHQADFSPPIELARCLALQPDVG
jgi:hypothetical protein